MKSKQIAVILCEESSPFHYILTKIATTHQSCTHSRHSWYGHYYDSDGVANQLPYIFYSKRHTRTITC